MKSWCTLVALAVVGVGSTALTGTAHASVAPSSTAPRIAVSIPSARQATSHALASSSRVKNIEYSTNWGGYTDTGTTFTSVTTTWTQPSVKCGSGESAAAFWDGLDGYSSSSVEQTGVLAECDGGSAYYYDWYELYPANPVYWSSTVRPGDRMTATVDYTGGKYVLTLKDSTEGWTNTKSASGSYARSSAEVIVEAPYSGGVLPLSNFGSVGFSGSSVDGQALNYSGFTAHQMDIESSGGTLEESTSALSGGTSFTATWDAS
jgi:hypothetical protein